MSEFVNNYIKKYKPSLLKSEKYIKDNDWTLLGDIEFKAGKAYNPKKEEFLVQDQSVLILLDRLKFFAKKANDFHKLPQFKKYIAHVLKVVSIHTDRVDSYINGISLSDIKTTDLKKEEMEFHNILQKKYNTIDDTIGTLDIKFSDEGKADDIEFHENTKIAQLCMHEILYNEYPEIKRKIDEMGIDFITPPKNEMHIHNPNPPKWDRNKHYFNQEKETLQYYVDEQKKNENGVSIGGIHFEPWLYFHMNHFVTEIPTEEINKITGEKKIKKKNRVPPLRDNEYYIIQDNYRTARETGKMLFIAATRRLFKSTGLASHLYHKAITGAKELLVAGGSAKDLGQLEKNIKTCALYINPAFAVNNISSDWTKKIPLGIRTKTNKVFTQCIIHVVNLDGGNNSEILAGYTPEALVIDEILKNPFIDQLNGAKPSFDTPNGMLCTPILSGTGGDELMAQDGFKVLNDPESYKVLPMNWEALERGMDKEDILWVRREFGTFAPAAMSAKTGMIKIKSNLADYLGLPNEEELRKIEILVTDWKKCNEIIQKDRDALVKDKKSYNKEIVYYPNDPTEIFASGNINPFPVEEAKAHKQYLLDTGKWDRRRELYKDTNGRIHAKISKKELAVFPHKGGKCDAPLMLIEDLPETKPKYGLYTGGFDDTKQEDSDTDSLASFVVWKNEVIGDPFSDKPVATLKFKPDKRNTVYEQWLLLMEAFNLERTTFGENIDFEIKSYLDRFHLSDKYLATSLDFSSSFNIPNNNKRKFGWNPSTSKRILFDMFVSYCNEVFEVEQEDGKILILKGVQRIDDISLLDEIIQYNDNLNVDLITSAMGAYGYKEYLKNSYIWRVPTIKSNNSQDHMDTPSKPQLKNFYSNPSTRRGFYRRK